GIAGFPAVREVKPCFSPGQHSGEWMQGVTDLLPERIGKRTEAIYAAAATNNAGQPDLYQFLRVHDWQRANANRVEQLKDRRIGPDAESQAENGNCGKPRVLEQGAKSVS